MKKALLRLAKVVGGLIASVIVLVVGTVLVLNTDSFQNRIMQYATQTLSDTLKTHVSIDHVSVGLFSQDVRLYGLDVEDQQQRKMLQLDTLSVNVDLLPLLSNEVRITKVRVKGVRALLLKPSPDSVANYQFVIDTFKKKGDGKAKKPEEKKGNGKKKKFNLAVGKGSLEHIKVTFNNQKYYLDALEYQQGKNDTHTAYIRKLQRHWVAHTKHGDVDDRLTVGLLTIVYGPDKRHVSLEDANFFTDGHKPRKNTGKPKRGFFDADHLDVIANLKADITHVEKDSIAFDVTECRAVDVGSGLKVDHLQLKGSVSHGMAYLRDVDIKLPNTQLQIAHAKVQLPSKKKGIKLSYQTSPLKARVILKDISRPFAPVLSNFTVPLNLNAVLSGNDESMTFRNVVVSTADKLLTVKASGSITGLKNKYDLAVRFHVDQMVAKGGSKERIISQFPVKKFMMKQLHNLGTIYYTGDFAVLWKKEVFSGLLTATTGGRLNFQLALDELNKYVSGTVRTDSFELGRVMGMPDLGKIACTANFKFDVSKPRTAKMRKLKGGKLPIGQVEAQITEAKYKKLTFRNIIGTIDSDGAVANGNITVKGKRVDLLCSFSFTNTNEMQKTKIKPGVKFHKLSDEDRAAKEALKQQKAEEKAAKKAAKAEAKAAKKAAKAEAKAAKKAAKAEEKAAKDAEKAQEKAAKDAEKAAKKAEKEARKAAKKAEKEARKAAKAAAADQ